jgi:hypothetical protein
MCLWVVCVVNSVVERDASLQCSVLVLVPRITKKGKRKRGGGGGGDTGRRRRRRKEGRNVKH